MHLMDVITSYLFGTLGYYIYVQVPVRIMLPMRTANMQQTTITSLTADM